ncbi:hypothetical protein LguiA_014784 [Lonicera macranthoides]
MLHHTQLSKQLIHHPLPPKFKFISTNQTQPPNSFSFLLDLCNNPKQLQHIHARFILHGLHQNPILSSKLIDNYANFGLFNLSQKVFNSNTNPTRTVYGSFVKNLYKFGEYKNALLVYQEMVVKSIYPDEYAYPFVLKSCFELGNVKNGKKIHGHMVKLGFDSDDLVGSALVEMYRVFDASGDAHQQSDKKPINWNSLIFEAFQNGDHEGSFRIFERMKMERFGPDSVTVVNLLRASVELKSLKLGRLVHGWVLASNLCESLDVNTALLSMYSKLGCLKDARLMFDKMPERDCVVWNLMISAYSNNGSPKESLDLLMQMVKCGIRPDLFTAIASISSIADLKSLKQGKQMHAHVVRNGSDYQVSVHNSLIDMYCKCDCLMAAIKVFDSITNKTVVSWSSIIKGYVSNEQFYDAISFFTKMKSEGFRIDSVTVINILPACVKIGVLKQVKYLHGYSTKSGLNSVPSLNTSLLVSYAKSGCIEMARKLFDEDALNTRDVITWNSMISACSKHGDWIECFDLYNKMKQLKLKPDRVTFLGMLTACVNSGSLKEGWGFFKEMTETYGCQPSHRHYACMVDLLGRTGHIREATELINSMPFIPDSQVWGPLLSACKLHSDTRVAELAAERLMSLEPKNAGNYVLLSNIYAAAGKWEGVARMRVCLRDKGLKKTPGCSWLEINGQVHEFRVADQSHPWKDYIYTILRNLELEIKEIKYKRSANFF